MKKIILIFLLSYSFFVFSQKYKYEYELDVPYNIFYFCEIDSTVSYDTTIIMIIDSKGEKYDIHFSYVDGEYRNSKILFSKNGFIVLDSSNFNLQNYILIPGVFIEKKIPIYKYYKKIVIIIAGPMPINSRFLIKSTRPLNNSDFLDIRENFLIGKKSQLELDNIIKILYII